jgi:hypothetical protein
MSRDTRVIPFRQPDAIEDALTEVARDGARRAEADAFVALWKDLNKRPRGWCNLLVAGAAKRLLLPTAMISGKVDIWRSGSAICAKRSPAEARYDARIAEPW